MPMIDPTECFPTGEDHAGALVPHYYLVIVVLGVNGDAGHLGVPWPPRDIGAIHIEAGTVAVATREDHNVVFAIEIGAAKGHNAGQRNVVSVGGAAEKVERWSLQTCPIDEEIAVLP